MAQDKFLPIRNLQEWLEALSRERRVLVPVEEGGSVVFRPFEAGARPVLSVDATASLKSALFPPSHELFRFEQTKDPEDPERSSLTLTPDIPQVPTVVFGGRPCGARGALIFDRVYLGERFPDPYYRTSRENTLFVTLACENPGNTCFCHWVGGGPDDPTGSDVLMTAVEGGYVLQSVSERGAALLDGGGPLLSSDESKSQEAAAARAKARASLGPATDLGPAQESLLALFDDRGFWEDASAKCINCGACTYLCPTCYCFTITDEASGLSGRRVRSWDTCMSFQFTLEASGHNPRPGKANRLKNRVGHKFSYYPARYGGLPACCGCGRCIRKCPASVDIREIVTGAIKRAGDNLREASNG